MSNCWCKCEAGVGQCGPKVPKLKALFRSYKDGDDGPIRRNDRQAELESLWQECGEDKLMRQEDLKVALADAVDRVYDKCQEDAMRRRAALMANVLASEERIRDILGIEAEIAPKELPLQTRLDANLSRLHELENLRGDGFGWMGGLVILMELRRRMSALRTTIRVPDGPEGSKLEEMLHSTMDALEHPDKDSSERGSSKAAPRTLKKPMFQRLESFYKNLCGLDGAPEPLPPANPSVEKPVSPGRPPKVPKRDGEPVSPPGSALKMDYPQIRVSAAASPDTGRAPKESYPLIIAAPTDIQEELTLESLGAKIIKKIDEINAKHAPPPSTAPAPPPPPGDNKRPLPPSPLILPQPKIPRCISISAPPFLWPTDLTALAETQRALEGSSSEEEPGVSGGGSFFSSFFPVGGRSAQQTGVQFVNGVSGSGSAGDRKEEGRPEGTGARRLNLFGGFFASGKSPREGDAGAVSPAEPALESSRSMEARRADSAGAPAEQPPVPPPRTPLHQSASEGALNTPTAAPPPPPPRRVASSGGPAPPPPPPPPARKEGGGEDGKGRKGAAGATAAGMAEMLGEITKRSAYFQQIAADVKQHAAAIEQAKAAIETFQTADMDALLAFRTSVENALESLTDESQVLARFEGFPSRKLETIRMAASLHSRLAGTAKDLEQWKVAGGAYEELERAIKYFDKMKKEVEACERTQDEDGRRFAASKISFDWTTITRVKEAAVGLSGRLLEITLQESRRLRQTVDFESEPSPADVSKVRQQVHTIWAAFQFAFRVYNFAGGQDEKGEQLAEAMAEEIEAYPAGAWS
ncbi:hypothetical protein KFL_003000170 [Klebsormidium nitens]|uniref:Hydroxyproline-rich glycoprotein family protein n=1 Tax=Klebsormidium nitens TaxID=105231 RepID=A0A1Y1I6P4_KLENI|nr:hypothetical protein KFL_003000170 [Klebsormidium nitens]|eukprot:GAQ86624.1 hypothetical protein KFL_003000170 [Klebsormidium nitens]